jgi:peptide/nickel transport system permease protein
MELGETKIDVIKITKQYKKRSQTAEVWKRLSRNKAALLGLATVIMLFLTVIFADVLYDYNDVVIKQNIPDRLQQPTWKHPFGTDELGRDILARIVHGGRMSLSISLVSVAFALLVGGILGAITGYFGGKIDMFIMRIMDIFLAIPATLLAITIVAALGPSAVNLVIALAVSNVPTFSRIVRGSVLMVRDVEFIEAAKAIGATNTTIILEHILPNSFAPVLVQTTLSVAVMILTTAGLSFLGLGVQVPTPEWGFMLSSGRTYIRDNSYMTLFPGLAIMVTILSLNLLGDGLRDALDPRLK